MSIINIDNVINVSVMASPAGLLPYSVNNIVCFTKDVPVVMLADDYAAYSSARDVGIQWGTGSDVYKAASAVFSQSPNIITGGGLFIVVPMLSPSETLAQAMIRAQSLCYYGGCATTFAVTDVDILAAGLVAESERKLLFVTADLEAALQGPNGLFFKVQDQGLHHVRCLYYSNPVYESMFKWAYMGRCMSVNFSATNTTMTPQLKQLIGVPSDSMSQTVLNEAKAVGADVYVNIAGRPSLLASGTNQFFDDVYNLDWFVGALQVGGFNYLARTSTKIPQTEPGMDGLKGAYRNVCQQSVANGFVAPGTWTSPDTFGNPQDFIRNIVDFGYFIYSQPVGQQPAVDREQRKAPVVQVAIKYAGAIHSSDVLVYINQ